MPRSRRCRTSCATRMRAGALGLSVSRNQGHYDPQGVHLPALWADEKEMFALCDVLRELGTGVIQSGGGNGAEMKNSLMSRLSEATGRPVDLQQPQPVDAPSKRVEGADGARRCDRRQGHPRLSDLHAQPHHRLLHDAQHADLPRAADLASDPARLGRGEAARLQRSRGAQEAARRGGRVQGRLRCRRASAAPGGTT